MKRRPGKPSISSAAVSVLFAAVVSYRLSGCDAVVKIDGSQRMVFKTPDLSEEEEHSFFLPEELRCDGCRAVAFQLHNIYDDFNRRFKQYKFNLPEYEVLDLTEQACVTETFSNYGLKEVEGVHRLTGPGLETEDAPGVVSGGGRWSRRLYELCATFIEHLGETAIYDAFRTDRGVAKRMESFLCRGHGIRGSCRSGTDP